MYYVKKPIPVKAVQLIPDNEDFLLKNRWVSDIVYDGDHLDHAFIDTLEGRMRSNYGDWILQGVEGETWSIKKDIFEKTYEKHDGTKHQIDVSGNPPYFKSGERVRVRNSKEELVGRVIRQIHRCDDYGSSWGDVLIKIDGYTWSIDPLDVERL